MCREDVQSPGKFMSLWDMCVNVVFEARPHGERGGPSILIPTKKFNSKLISFLTGTKKIGTGIVCWDIPSHILLSESELCIIGGYQLTNCWVLREMMLWTRYCFVTKERCTAALEECSGILTSLWDHRWILLHVSNFVTDPRWWC